MTPKVRQTIYLVGTVVSGVVALLLTWRVIDPGTAASISTIIGAVGTLFGTGASATAAVAVSKQTKSGAFDPADPVQAIIDNVPVVVAKANTALDDLNKVKDATADLASIIPGVGPLAQQVIDSVKLP